MIGLAPGARFYLRCRPTDLRKAFDGLAGLVEEDLGHNLYDAVVVLFCNRARNRLKAIYWDGSGLCLFAKRLEAGTFSWPDSAEQAKEITPAELSMLLEGVDFRSALHRRWHRRRPATSSTQQRR